MPQGFRGPRQGRLSGRLTGPLTGRVSGASANSTPGVLAGGITGFSSLVATFGLIGALLGTSALTGTLPNQGALAGGVQGTATLAGDFGGLPAGAVGDWAAVNYVATPRKLVKNSITNGANDNNLLAMPRRQFNNNFKFYSISSLTVTDEAATAPDGTNEASTLVAASVVAWQLQFINVVLPAGTYTVATSIKSLSGSSQGFRFYGNGAGPDLTATTSWTRQSYTFTAGAGNQFISLQAPAASSQANLAVIDFQLFAGSSDLNATALTAAPIAVQNGDAILGNTHFDTGLGVSGGMVLDTALGFAQLLSPQTPAAFTVVWASNPTGASAGSSGSPMTAILSISGNNWFKFANGFCIDAANTLPGGMRYNNNNIGVNNSGVVTSGGTWGRSGQGVMTGAARYTGAVASMFVNGLRMQNGAVSPGAAPTFKDVCLGGVRTNNTDLPSGHSWGRVVLYMRALTDAEIRTAHNALVASFGAIGLKRVLGLDGTSISANLPTYQSLLGPNLSPQRLLSAQAVASATIASAVSTHVADLDQLISSGPPQTEYVLSVELGTNDLFAARSPATVASDLAAYIDARIAAGWQKIVCHTILPRSGVGGTTEAQFNSDRATLNTTIRSWVGGRVTACADWAAEATMGPDGASNNVTYYNGDKTHPTTAGQTLLEVVTRAAINSV